MTIKHATASTFVFARLAAGWRLGLIVHPSLGRLMIPGGHVEADESASEAASREVAEETGLRVRLVPAPGAPVPAALAAHARLVSSPWWIVEQRVERDNHVGVPHVHVDHLYVAIARADVRLAVPAHPFSWHGQAELAGLDMFQDSRLLAAELFADIDAIASACPW